MSLSHPPLTNNPCSTTFCGCQTLPNFFQPQDQPITLSIYFHIIYIIIVIIVCLRVSLYWFIYKDYFPLKQKSPILCILMVLSICIQLIMYSVVYVFNYFTGLFTETKHGFRAVQAALEFSVYGIFLIRCLRIWYAHRTDKRRKGTLAYWVFEREERLAAVIVGVAVLRFVVVFVQPIFGREVGLDFAFSYEIAANNDEAINKQPQFVYRFLIANFLWQLVLTYCLYLQKTINYRYTMRYELSSLLACISIINVLYILTLYQSKDKIKIMQGLCLDSFSFPLTEASKIINFVFIMIVSICLPLMKKKVYHMLLPMGPHYGFITTMRNFLMEKQFLQVFSRYLQHLDYTQGRQSYHKILQLWQQLVKIQILHTNITDDDSISSIKSLLTQIPQNIFRDQRELVSNLQSTIINLQDVPRLQHQVQQMKLVQYRQSFNEKVNQLEDLTLKKLNRIFFNKYIETESYEYLREMISDYKRVNLNMMMMQMALIFDTDGQF